MNEIEITLSKSLSFLWTFLTFVFVRFPISFWTFSITLVIFLPSASTSPKSRLDSVNLWVEWRLAISSSATSWWGWPIGWQWVGGRWWGWPFRGWWPGWGWHSARLQASPWPLFMPAHWPQEQVKQHRLDIEWEPLVVEGEVAVLVQFQRGGDSEGVCALSQFSLDGLLNVLR